MKQDSYVKFFTCLVLTLVFVFSLFNFFDQMKHAQNKEFWLDEKYSLKATIQEHSYLGLLAKGAVNSETNAAPLDYLVIKVFDDVKNKFGTFGLSDKVYYRLWADFCMVFSGFLIVCLFIREILRSEYSNPIKIFQLLLLIFLPLLYLYRPMTYHYGAEVRPYSLWFALWFIAIAICSMRRINKVALSIVLSLLSMTMVGCIFQILSIGLAYFAVQLHREGCKQAIKDCAQVFIVPIFIVVFYAFPASYGNRAFEPWSVSWHHFHELWGHELIAIPMLLVTIVSLYLSRRTQSMSIGPIAVLIVLLLGPFIFYLTLKRGYFFTERQYIYYDANRAIFWMSLINAVPFYLERIKESKKQFLAMGIIFMLCLPFVFPKKTIIYIRKVMCGTVGHAAQAPEQTS